MDYLIENGQVKNAAVTEDYDAFRVAIVCPKFIADAPPAPPKPKPKPAVVRPAPKPSTFENSFRFLFLLNI